MQQRKQASWKEKAKCKEKYQGKVNKKAGMYE